MRALAQLVIVLACLLSNAAFAAPDFPTLTGRVVDQAAILSEPTQAQLDGMLSAHESETSNQVVVVTLADLQGYDIGDYGYQLGRHWEIGTAENNNGVLLIIAPNERKMRIEVGYGLEGALTDGLSRTIIQREITPAFRAGRFDEGVLLGTNAILRAIKGEYAAPEDTPGKVTDAGEMVPIVFFSFMLGSAFLGRMKRKGLASGIVGAGAGTVALLVTKVLLTGAVVGVLAAVLFLVFGGGSGGGSGRSRRGGGYYPGGLGGGGGFGGGGFGGGGGSFGGGGASGGW
ncbi:MAG: YgcG family protein [Pseudomonadales bacterium]